MFEYKYLRVHSTDLQSTLTRLGFENWRLHTCDFVKFSPVIEAFIVMDRIKEQPEKPESDSQPSGMSVT
jgi:hypothetical protein